MTRVYLAREGDGYVVRCRGHATGENALTEKNGGEGARVCAGISCLCCALEGWLQGTGVRTEELRLAPGEAVFRFSGGERARGAFELAAIGFLRLEKTAPERVRVEIKNFP